MTNTKKIAQNSLIQIVGKVISTFFGLLALGMMTRFLGTEGFGWYTSAIGILQFIGILTDFGMTPVTVKMLSEHEPPEAELLFRNILGFRLTTAVIVFGATPLIAYFAGFRSEIVQAVAILAIGFIGIAMNQVFLGLYQSRLRLITHSIGEVISRLFLVIGVWQVIYHGFGFLSIMWMVTISAIIFTTILAVKSRREIRTSLAFDLAIWKKIIRIGWPISMAIIFNVVYLKGDIIILNWFVSQSDIGIYGAAYRVLDVLTQAAMMLMGIFLPLLTYHWSHRLRENFRRYYQQAFDTLMIFAMPMTVGGVLLATPIITLVAGPDFVSSGNILAILTIAVFGVYLGAIFGHTAVAIDRQREAMWIYLSTAIITLTGYLIVIPLYGIYGAAVMTVISELYTGIALYILVTHYSGEGLKLARVSRALMSSIIMGVTIYLAPDYHIAIQIILGGCLYLSLLFLSGALPRTFVKEIFSIKNP